MEKCHYQIICRVLGKQQGMEPVIALAARIFAYKELILFSSFWAIPDVTNHPHTYFEFKFFLGNR
jgi:hypothetical protein